MTNLSRDGIQLKLDDLKFVDIESNSADGKRTSLAHGDILISITAELGKIGWIPPDLGEAFINQHTALVRLDNTKADSRFVAHLLSTPKLNKEINRMNDSGAKAGLNLPTIKAININLPVKDEQTKIANFLTAVDEKITQLTKKCDLLVQYKKGVMQQIFSQELRFKADDGQDYPDWETKPLGTIASFIKDGTHGTHKDTEDGEYYLLSAKNISNGKINFDDSDRRISKEEFDSIYKNYTLKDGDVLLSVVGTIGRVAIYSSEFGNVAFQRSVAFFRFDKQCSQFIAQLFASANFQKQLLINQVVSAQAGIYLGDLAKIKIEIPVLAEQTKIANFLTAIDEKITQTQTQLFAVKQYKQGLLQQMLV